MSRAQESQQYPIVQVQIIMFKIHLKKFKNHFMLANATWNVLANTT